MSQRIIHAVPRLRKFLGRRATIALIVGILAGLSQGVVEMGMTAFLQLFLRETMILATAVQLPKILEMWHPSVGVLAMTLVGIGVLRSFNQFLITHGSAVANESINARLRLTLLHRVLHARHHEVIPASYSHTLIASVFPVASAVFAHVATAVPNAVMVVALLIAMQTLAPKETAFGLVGIVILGIVVNRINKNIAKIAKRQPIEHAELSKGIERVARNWLLVKILRTEDSELDRMQGNVLRQQEIATRINFWIQFSSVLPSSFGVALIATIIAFSLAYWHTPGLVLLSFLYLFLRFVQVFSGVVTSLAHAYGGKAQFFEAWNFFFADSNADADIITSRAQVRFERAASAKQLASAKVLDDTPFEDPPGRPSITATNLQFRYGDHLALALNIKELNVTPGAQLGIVGPSGSGKSTLLLLILGILRPTAGSLLIDGVPPEAYFATVRRIGYVGAEPFLIAGSIRENITYGLSQSVTDDACWKALKAASLGDFVRTLGAGLAYEIREDGAGLSAGQKQRIALARAFLMKPELLILDEATANLDAATEAEIVASVSALRGTVTTIIVSHREAALAHADQRIVLC